MTASRGPRPPASELCILPSNHRSQLGARGGSSTAEPGARYVQTAALSGKVVFVYTFEKGAVAGWTEGLVGCHRGGTTNTDERSR